jgi:hypothetical protein
MLKKPAPIKSIISGTTSINAYIQSGDFDITNTNNIANLQGDGDFIMSVKRFIPDFKVLSGNSKVTLLLNNYPADTASSSPLGTLYNYIIY